MFKKLNALRMGLVAAISAMALGATAAFAEGIDMTAITTAQTDLLAKATTAVGLGIAVSLVGFGLPYVWRLFKRSAR